MGNWVTITSVFFPQSFPKQNVKKKKGEKLSCSAQNLLGLCIKMFCFFVFLNGRCYRLK